MTISTVPERSFRSREDHARPRIRVVGVFIAGILAFLGLSATPPMPARAADGAPPAHRAQETTPGSVVATSVEELASALERANAGGVTTILLADGTYELTDMLPIWAAGISVRGQSGNRDAVILRGQGMHGAVTHIFNVAGSGFSARDMTLRDVSQHAVQLQIDVDNVSLRNLHILDTGEQMVKVAYDPSDPRSSDNGLLEHSLLEYSAGIGPQWYIGGIDAHFARNWTVRNNTFAGIRSPSGAVAEHAIHFWSGSENTLVEGNTVVNCDRGIGFGLGGRGHVGGIIRNNMIYHDATAGFADVGIGLESAAGAQVYNNTILFEHGYPNAIEYRFAGTTGVLIANNLTNRSISPRDGASATLSHNLTGALPEWFVDPSGGDLHLASRVPSLVDQGTHLNGLTRDFDGEARPQGAGFDIGADEFMQAASVQTILIAPSGDTTDPTPTYQWRTVDSSTGYLLLVTDTVGMVFWQWYRPDEVCTASLCTATPEVTLAPGPHHWWIQAYNASELGHRSAPMAFMITPAAAGLIQPEELEYLGAFRVPDRLPGAPDAESWEYAGEALAYNPDGDPAGAADGFPGSLFGTGHAVHNHVSEIGIPAPSLTRMPAELPLAETLQDFSDIRAGLFDAFVEMPRVGLEYLPAQAARDGPKLHLAWGQHMQEDSATRGPSHAWSETDLSAPSTQGAWWIGEQSPYSVNGYLFSIPKVFADAHLGGLQLATGRFRDGGWSGMGPSLFAYAPWLDGNPPAPWSRLNALPLLLYSSTAGDTPGDHRLYGYHHSDEWEGGAWLDNGGRSAVVFAGTKGAGHCWYGYYSPAGDGMPCVHQASSGFTTCYNPDGSECPAELQRYCPGHDAASRGWWSSRFDAQILFYDPADFAAVAAGAMLPHEPQPYATLDIDEHLFLDAGGPDLGYGDQRRYRLGETTYDRERGLLYILEWLAEGEGKPLVHVWRVCTGQGNGVGACRRPGHGRNPRE